MRNRDGCASGLAKPSETGLGVLSGEVFDWGVATVKRPTVRAGLGVGELDSASEFES